MEIRYPIEDSKLILRACNAQEPLPPGDPRWHDFESLRGPRIQARLQRVFEAAPAEGRFHHRLLCGHRGCGKSTELLRFKKWAEGRDFACRRIEVDVQIGQIDLEFSDFFLLAATEAERALEELGFPIAKQLRRPIVDWFAEVTSVDETLRKSELGLEASAQAEGGVPFLAKLTAKFFSGMKVGATHARTVRQELRNSPDRLIDLTNALLDQAHRQLSKLSQPRKNGLVLLFDNLDRYLPDQVDQVLIGAANLLTRLRCHALFTIPVDLEYNPRRAPLRDAYGQPFVLPMIPLRPRGAPWRSTVKESEHRTESIDELRRALARRLVLDKVFEVPADADELLRMSGGCLRDVIHLMTLAYEFSEGDRLTTQGCRSAIRELRATYSRGLSHGDYERLAAIAAGESVDRDDLSNQLLYQRRALEYYDEDDEVWLGIHPVIVEIEEFQKAHGKSRTIL
jgi:hypothetical protein